MILALLYIASHMVYNAKQINKNRQFLYPPTFETCINKYKQYKKLPHLLEQLANNEYELIKDKMDKYGWNLFHYD